MAWRTRGLDVAPHQAGKRKHVCRRSVEMKSLGPEMTNRYEAKYVIVSQMLGLVSDLGLLSNAIGVWW
jgi:hypothetical protein